MGEPIRGKNVVFKFYKEGQFLSYGCATNCTFDGDMEVKSVKTVGDGTSAQWRGQKTSYTLTVEGIIVIDEPNYVTAFDLLDYWKAMVEIEYQMVFTRVDNSEITMIRGRALIQKPNISAPVGFVATTINMLGNGEPLFGLPPTCDKIITSYQVIPPSLGYIYQVKILTLNSGSVARYDWSIDGGAVKSAFDTGWSFNLFNEVGAFKVLGGHDIEIWPICDNGVQGQKLTHHFVYPQPNTCNAKITEVNISLASGQRTITVLSQTNAVKYDWVYSIGGSSVASGTANSDSWTTPDQGLGKFYITPKCSNDIAGTPIVLELTAGQSPACAAEIRETSYEDGDFGSGLERRILISEVINGTPIKYSWVFYAKDPNFPGYHSGEIVPTNPTIFPISFTSNLTVPGVFAFQPYCTSTTWGTTYYLIIE